MAAQERERGCPMAESTDFLTCLFKSAQPVASPQVGCHANKSWGTDEAWLACSGSWQRRASGATGVSLVRNPLIPGKHPHRQNVHLSRARILSHVAVWLSTAMRDHLCNERCHLDCIHPALGPRHAARERPWSSMPSAHVLTAANHGSPRCTPYIYAFDRSGLTGRSS
jgi:hypothetical protein